MKTLFGGLLALCLTLTAPSFAATSPVVGSPWTATAIAADALAALGGDDAGNLTKGTLNVSRLPSNVFLTDATSVQVQGSVTFLGDVTFDHLSVTEMEGNASGLTGANPATLFGTGVVPIANLATGTPTGAKFVRDDNTLAEPTVSSVAPSVITSQISGTNMGVLNSGNRLVFDGSTVRWLDKKKDIFIEEEFFGNANNVNYDPAYSCFAQSLGGGGFSAVSSLSGAADYYARGIVQLLCNSASDYPVLYHGSRNRFGLGRVLTQNRVKIADLSTASDTYEVRIGFADGVTATPANAIYASYTSANVYGTADTHWALVCTSSSSSTVVYSSVEVAAHTWYWVDLEVKEDGSECYLYINGTKVATNTTNMAGKWLGFLYGINCTAFASGNKNLYVDYHNLWVNFGSGSR